MSIQQSKLIALAHEFVRFDEDELPLLTEEWQGLDLRVKWFLTMLGVFRHDALDGKVVTVTSILGLDNPRKYHKDGLAADIRTRDMTRLARTQLRSFSYSLRNHVNVTAKDEGWNFGFDPHDSYERNDPPWHGEHFHVFVRKV